jgi:hypothetical protein
MLSTAVAIQDGGALMVVGSVAAPCVVDWNRDGRKDLLVADSSCGQVMIFLNEGTDRDPQFLGGTPVESDGQPIITSHG